MITLRPIGVASSPGMSRSLYLTEMPSSREATSRALPIPGNE